MSVFFGQQPRNKTPKTSTLEELIQSTITPQTQSKFELKRHTILERL